MIDDFKHDQGERHFVGCVHLETTGIYKRARSDRPRLRLSHLHVVPHFWEDSRSILWFRSKTCFALLWWAACWMPWDVPRSEARITALCRRAVLKEARGTRGRSQKKNDTPGTLNIFASLKKIRDTCDARTVQCPFIEIYSLLTFENSTALSVVYRTTHVWIVLGGYYIYNISTFAGYWIWPRIHRFKYLIHII